MLYNSYCKLNNLAEASESVAGWISKRSLQFIEPKFRRLEKMDFNDKEKLVELEKIVQKQQDTINELREQNECFKHQIDGLRSRISSMNERISSMNESIRSVYSFHHNNNFH